MHGCSTHAARCLMMLLSASLRLCLAFPANDSTHDLLFQVPRRAGEGGRERIVISLPLVVVVAAVFVVRIFEGLIAVAAFKRR